MALRGTRVRIIVHEPATWDKGNLFGTIIFDRGGNRLIVKLSTTITVNQFTSDLLELSPHHKGDTFKPLTQYYSVMVDGSLIDESKEINESLIYGSITFDGFARDKTTANNGIGVMATAGKNIIFGTLFSSSSSLTNYYGAEVVNLIN